MAGKLAHCWMRELAINGNLPINGSGEAMDQAANSNGPKGRERREHPRQRTNLTAAIYSIGGRQKLNGQLKDLSLSGCRIRTDRPLDMAVSTRIEAGFYYLGMPFRVGGVIQGIYGPEEAGIRFVEVTERIQEKLRGLMEELGKTGTMD